MSNLPRYFLPAWLVGTLVPLPAILFWPSDDGVRAALILFFISSAGLVSYSFLDDARSRLAANDAHSPACVWHKRMLTLSAAVLASFAIFATLVLVLSNPADFVSPFLALLLVAPSLCVPPLITLLTGKPFASVVFTLFALFCVKLFGCVVVVLVYGWNASQYGHTTLPWSRPNLLVWLVWSGGGAVCLACYVLGQRAFCKGYTQTV